MENHLVSDNNCNPPKKLQGMTNNVKFTFGVSDNTLWFTICIEPEN